MSEDRAGTISDMNQSTNRLTRIRLATLLIGIAVVCLGVGWYLMQANDEQSKKKKSVETTDEVNGSNRVEDQIDIRSVEPDLVIPKLETGDAKPGKRTREVVPEFANTTVYHVTYLPVDWEPGKSYPVIVEYAGNGGYQNEFGDVCTGVVEDSKLGYGISAGQGLIWVCLPFLNANGTLNARNWWGDPQAFDPQPTIDYCKQAVPMICEKYGGDPDRVLLTGFSRGAVACNFIGLHDDEIAKLWKGFVPYSHYDGVSNFGLPGLDRKLGAPSPETGRRSTSVYLRRGWTRKTYGRCDQSLLGFDRSRRKLHISSNRFSQPQ